MTTFPAVRLLAPLLASLLLLAGCGGGSDGGGASSLGPPPSERFGASSLYANQCSLQTQKQFVRAYMDEHYLWYNEIPEVDPARYGNIPDYFHALLVRTPDANGLPKDQFSAVIPAAQASAILEQSSRSQPRASHTDAVPVAKVVTSTGGRRVGYIQFNDHEAGAQDDLITAFRQVRDAGAQDLVLDLRFNSGGFLYIAQTAASLIAGPAVDGQVFERLQYNDKRGAETEARTLRFGPNVQSGEAMYATGTELPRLGLPRVYVLTSRTTCSASESIINGLRGVDVQVVLVGDTTCGKPYGFQQRNNCEWAFFPIEFKGSNAKGFGDYTSGFTPTCRVVDNPAVPADSPNDPLLVAALHHVDNGSCPAGTGGAVLSARKLADASSNPTPAPSRPAWAGRLLAPQR